MKAAWRGGIRAVSVACVLAPSGALAAPEQRAAIESAPAPVASPPPAQTPPESTIVPSARPEYADRGPAAVDPLDKPASYRSGVVFGVALGLGTLDVSGFPNSSSRLNDPAYHHSSGPVIGGGNRFFLMGALADQFNFGLWFGGMAGENDTTRVQASGGGFRIEAFPLFHIHPRLRDLGIVAQLGIGTAVADKKDKSLSVDGTQSFLGAGALYEFTHGHFIGLRPSVAVVAEYQYVTSPSIASHGLLVAARFAFYGGP